MNEIEKRQKQTMQDYFVKQVGLALEDMSGAVSTEEAKRLTYSLVTAAQDSIANGKKQFNWNQQSIHNFLTKVILNVSAGLDASNDEVYAFPYGNEMSVQPSYRGYRKLIKEHAVGKKIIDLQCYAVREGEEFNVEYGALDHKWYYKSKPFNSEPVIGYVTVLLHEDGTSRVMEHTLEDINKRRFAGTSGNSPAWKNWEVEMSKAKAIKRHARTVDIRLRQDIQEFMNTIEKEEQEAIEIKETLIELNEETEEVEETDQAEQVAEEELSDNQESNAHRFVDDEGELVGDPDEELSDDESWIG